MEIVKIFNERLVETSNSYADERRLTFKPVDSVLSIEALRCRLPITLPTELADLWIYAGAFESAFFADCWQTIRVYSARDLATLPCGLIDFIDHAWGGRPELKECFTRSELQAVNKRCIVFGYRYEDDNVHDYLYFDGDGNFGSLRFDQDDRDSWQPCIRDILSESAHVTSLDALLQDQFEIIGNVHDD